MANASFNVSSGSALTITPEDITVSVAGIDYAFTIGQDDYQLKSLFRQQTSTETRVFVSN